MVDINKILLRSLIGGIFIFAIQYLIERFEKPNLVGFFYGAIPYTFIFLSIIYSLENRKSLISKLSLSAGVGGIFFTLSMIIFYLSFERLKLNFLISLIICILSLLISIILSNEGYQYLIKYFKIENKYPNSFIEYLNKRSKD